MIKLKLIVEESWPKDLRKVWAFWMSPDGELFQVADDGGHLYMAREFLKKYYNITFPDDKWYNHDLRGLLYKRGWKDVSPSNVKGINCIFISPKQPLTNNQKKTIENMAMNSERSVFYDDMNFTPIFVLPYKNPFENG